MQEKGILHILIGLPGSGKTTFGKKLVEKLKKVDTHHHSKIIQQSSDEIRKMLYGTDTEQKNPALVFEILNKIVKTNLQQGMYVVYDATNINRKRRMNLIKEMKPFCDSIVCTVIATPLEIIYFQDQKRDRTVGKEAILKYAKSFQVPMFFEGFDSIEIYNVAEHWPKEMHISFSADRFFKEKIVNFEQDNNHHSYTLDKHMIKSKNYFESLNWDNDLLTKEDKTILVNAIYSHDIGKYYTKTFYNTKGDLTENAHYYEHAYVGAYVYLTLLHNSDITNYQLLDETLLRKIAYLIENHMTSADKVHEDYQKYIKIMQLCDDAAK